MLCSAVYSLRCFVGQVLFTKPLSSYVFIYFISNATFGYCYNRLSLSSVTRVYCDKVTEAKITRFLLKSSLVFDRFAR